MNLEQMQKERMESFRNTFGKKKNVHADREWIESFLSESIRIAYEAGKEACLDGLGRRGLEILRKDERRDGYRSGIERAKELVNGIENSYLIQHVFPSDSDIIKAGYENRKRVSETILSALDDELKKL